MRQAAHYDLRTTEGLAQVQHLRFILPSGEVDTQYNGMTIRGGVLVDVIQDMPGSEVVDGRCALQLPRLAAGCHRYDVLVSDDGTDKPLLAGVIHVAPRVTPVDLDDSAPADYLDIVMPADEGGTITVISESPAWVDDAVEQSLQERGMYVSPTSGTVSMSPPGYDQDQAVAWSWARFRFGDDMLGGYRGSVCKVRDVYMWSVIGTTDTTPRWLDIWRRAPGGDWVLAARSGQAVASSTDVDLYMWGMIGDTEIVIGDEVALHVYGGTPEAPVELPLSIARQIVTAADGRGIASALDGPITDATVMPAVMLSCTYQDGVSVGGVNLATRAEVQRLTDYAANVSKQTYQDARTSEAARDAAQEVVSGMTLTAGTITTGAPGSQATAELKPGSTAGSYTLDMVIPRGDAGTVNTSQPYVWTQPQTYDAMINANGGINLPIMPVMDTDCANLAFVKAFSPLFISTCNYINVAITGDANRYKVYPDRVYCKDTWGISEHTRCEITSLKEGTDYEGSDCVFIPCDILVKNRAPAQKISISWGGTVNSSQSVLGWDVDASAPFSLTIELLFQDDAGESSTRSIQVRKRQMGFNQETVVETDWLPVDAYPDNFANGGDTVLSIGLVYAQKSENWEEAEGCLYFLCYHITRGRYYAFPLIRTHGKHNYFSRLSSPRIILTNEAYGTAKAYGNVHLDAPIIYYGPNNAFYQFITSIEHTF